MDKKNYNIYNHSSLKSAEVIEVKKSIYVKNDKIGQEIETILNGEYLEDLKRLKKEEKDLFNDLIEKMEAWEELAYKIRLIREAKHYKELCNFVKDLQTTNNNYIETKDGWRSKEIRISNKVYNLYFRVYKNTTYQNKEEKFLCYEVSYFFSINLISYSEVPTIRRLSIKEIRNKKCFNDEELTKYIEGRKKYFSKYFKDEYPAIPAEFINNFSHKGKLIKGYTVEDQDQETKTS